VPPTTRTKQNAAADCIAAGAQQPRIVLDAPRASDSDALFGWINDSETVRLNGPYRPIDEASHEAWFRAIGQDPTRVVFAIRVEGRLIGTVQLTHIQSVHRSAEMSIRIGDPGDRARGWGTAAVKAALRFSWEDLNLQRVSLHAFYDNAPAIACYVKAGFVHEGTLRRAAYIGGAWKDVVIMAALRPTAD
jgi:RimJ/RimL family protein N-acetyltransferase